MMLRLTNIVETALLPALALLPHHLDTRLARVLMLAIGLQESGFEHRYQIVKGGGKGPARSFWQMELGSRETKGGIWGIYLHRASSELLRLLCRERDCQFDPQSIWEQIERDDVLAAGCARLLLLTCAKPLPALGDVEGAWRYYAKDTWRPGKPHRKTWDAFYANALEYV